jgi:hypothetical protein
MLILGNASAMSFTPLQLNIAGEPVLDVIDRIAGKEEHSTCKKQISTGE